MDVSFIIINYRSRNFLENCIKSIFKYATNFSFEVIIINNDREALEKILDSYDLKIVENNLNKGFSHASNLGAEKATGKILFFLNADTELTDYNIIDIKNSFNDPLIGAAAPKLILPNGHPQSWGAGYEITFWDIIKNNLGYIKSKAVWFKQEISEVDWASGAALAVSKEVFEKCHGFDENFFMYFEDVDLCRRIRNMGKKIILFPNAHVIHNGGQSKLNAKKQKEQYYLSQDYYFKKNFGTIYYFMIRTIRSIFLFFIG
ncbi:MAG TPA: glycosyltransferase family 2 protein [Candidatus Moranbacteria bacterium]|nr:glycosyltransferase family 2 protein [Candidatus Moranbacteria bacterium]HRZ33598.1 glycosyltransferase family 2 protein [Candidatus Moranbacteria bacterium]